MLARLAKLSGMCVAGSYTVRWIDDIRQPDAQPSLSADHLRDAGFMLNDKGVVVVQGCVDGAQLGRVFATEAYRSMPSSAAQLPSDDWRLSAFGRYHRVCFSASDESAISQLEEGFRSLVTEFFGPAAKSGIYRSELQLLTAVPASENQQWHSDNRQRGLTVVVPLTDFTPANGATQLLPFSHVGAWWQMLEHGGAKAVQAPVGSVVAYECAASPEDSTLTISTASDCPAPWLALFPALFTCTCSDLAARVCVFTALVCTTVD